MQKREGQYKNLQNSSFFFFKLSGRNLGIKVYSAPWCLAVGVSRADSSGNTSRVASSVDVSEGHHRGQVAEGVVGTGSRGDTSGVDSCGPLLPAGGRQLLLLPDQLVGPPGSQVKSEEEDEHVEVYLIEKLSRFLKNN